MMANQNRGNSPILCVCCNEIPGIGYEVVLLPTTQAEFANRGKEGPQIPLAD
jgi:hypothetical protein